MVAKVWALLSRRRKVGYALLAALGVVLIVLVWLAFTPPNLGALVSHPNPATNYAEGVARVTALQAQDTVRINPECATTLLTHGQTTAHAIVFIHGYTNCPKQFAVLGQQFYDLGYNVLIARMPHHGLTDVLTEDLTHYTADEMVAFGDQIVDAAAGLGEQVSVAGLSGGGVIAGWVAQQRSEVDQVVLINPGFGLKAIPAPLTQLVTNVVTRLPDSFSWWDPRRPDWRPDPTSPMAHAYPRFSFHGLAQQLRLSLAVRALARSTAPEVQSVVLITTASDFSVDNALAAQVVGDWRAHGVSDIVSYEFPLDQHVPHDSIDPGQKDQRVDLVYPKIIELVTR